MNGHDVQSVSRDTLPAIGAGPVQALVAHLRGDSVRLRQEWLRRIDESRLLSAMNGDGMRDEVASMYDNHVTVVGSGSPEALLANGRHVTDRLAPRGIEAGDVVGLVLLLREVVVRSLMATYEDDLAPLQRVLEVYEEMANRIAIGVVVACLQDREQLIEMQQEAVRELSCPILQVRDRLLLLPVVGPVDPARVSRLTTELLRAIRLRRARAVVLDVSGVPAIDAVVAAQLTQTVEAARLLGATIIVTGLSSAVAQSLVGLGISLDKVSTVGDLQGGIEEAEHLLGYRVVPVAELSADAAQERG